MADTGAEHTGGLEHAADSVAAEAQHTAHAVEGAATHVAHEGGHAGRHPEEMPELVSATQLWYVLEHGEGAPPEDINNLSASEVLHIGRLEKPAPLVGYMPWENNFFAIIAGVIMCAIAIILTRQVRSNRKDAVRRPGSGQVLAEMIVGGLESFVEGVLGPKHGKDYTPFIATLFLFILTCNLMGLVPLLKAPTAYILIPASLALMSFAVMQYTAIVKLGPGRYIYHLMGEPKDVIGWCLAIPFLLLETISTLAKPLSLTLRLFGNILGKDILLGAFVMMGLMLTAFVPLGGETKLSDFVGIPLTLPFYFLGLLLSTIQALVFALLSCIYVLLCLPHDHDHDHEEGHGDHGHDHGQGAAPHAAH